MDYHTINYCVCIGINHIYIHVKILSKNFFQEYRRLLTWRLGMWGNVHHYLNSKAMLAPVGVLGMSSPNELFNSITNISGYVISHLVVCGSMRGKPSNVFQWKSKNTSHFWQPYFNAVAFTSREFLWWTLKKKKIRNTPESGEIVLYFLFSYIETYHATLLYDYQAKD